MRFLICAIFLILGQPVWAKSVVVTSGEHDGFTRIVLDFGAAVNWTLGRTADGYALRVVGKIPTYDLAGLYDLIGKNRLAALWTNPETGQLNIGFACACHAIPFEFRPGIVVLDLRDGPPPVGSSFEEVMAALPIANNAATKISTPKYDWVPAYVGNGSPALPKKSLRKSAKYFAPKPTSEPLLQPLKDQLLRQLSRGAADGVVDLELPDTRAPQQKKPTYDAARVTLGEMPGVSIERQAIRDIPLGVQGEVCTSHADLDLQSWGDDTPFSQQIGPATTGILGEFDRPDIASVERAVHFMLFAGFGSEAIQLINAFAPDHRKAQLWRGLAEIVDGVPSKPDFFAQQASCDTPAALWSFLAEPDPKIGGRINVDAVILAFSNFPIHVRRNLGPKLAENFLRINDVTSAMTIQNAMMRAGAGGSSSVALSQVKIEMANGEHAAVEAKIDAISAASGPDRVLALIELVEARVAQSRPIEPKIALELAAVSVEMQGSSEGSILNRALILAQASSGAIALAISGSQNDRILNAQVWQILAQLGSDTDILVHAVLEQGRVPNDVGMEIVRKIIARLVDLGLPDAAAGWSDAYGISGINESAAVKKMDKLATRNEANKKSSPSEKNWTALELELGNLGQLPSTGGVLEQGHKLAEISAKTRNKVEALLEQVPTLAAP